MFFCSLCCPKVPLALKIDNLNHSVTSGYDSIQKAITEQSTKIDKLKSSELESQESIAKTTTSISIIPVESVEHIAVSLISEQKEKERRQLNIIIHKLEESSVNDGPSRKSDDIKRCESLFQTYLGIKVSITNAFRLGKNLTNPDCLSCNCFLVTYKRRLQY